ncbi:Histone deacetylase complex subunit SAP30L [Pitangus sulphuratus]|nr:Histone deacetylase complex subunit SAP30L [Pitangus sulphuratus]
MGTIHRVPELQPSRGPCSTSAQSRRKSEWQPGGEETRGEMQDVDKARRDVEEDTFMRVGAQGYCPGWTMAMVDDLCPAPTKNYWIRDERLQPKMKYNPMVRHLYICDFHKNFIQSVRNKRKRKTSDDGGDSPEHDTDVPEVDLFQLQVNTLRRYKRHYKLQTRPGLNKAQLAETVSRHFRNIPVNEKETLAYFIYMVKNNKSRLDQKSEGSKQLD